jgi:50S ribosomal protein L16 3-hydroxylase
MRRRNCHRCHDRQYYAVTTAGGADPPILDPPRLARASHLEHEVDGGETASMLNEWLGKLTIGEFKAEYLRRAPYVQPSAAAGAARALDWSTIDRLLQARADAMIVRNGRLDSRPAPPSLAGAQPLLAQGFSLVFRNCELHDPALRAVGAALAAELPGRLAVQVYVTPAACQGFSWHYDFEDVFVLQSAGSKTYYLRRNTVNPQPTRATMPKDMRYEAETSPTMAATLIAGDWLYIPSGWWHAARAGQASLSISIGLELAPSDAL